jgi:hypothetical protein
VDRDTFLLAMSRGRPPCLHSLKNQRFVHRRETGWIASAVDWARAVKGCRVFEGVEHACGEHLFHGNPKRMARKSTKGFWFWAWDIPFRRTDGERISPPPKRILPCTVKTPNVRQGPKQTKTSAIIEVRFSIGDGVP